MAAYSFDSSTGRYLDASGHALTRDELLAIAQDQQDATSADVEDITSELAAGNIDAGEWKDKMRDAILAGFVLLFLLGRGGESEMTEDDWQALGDSVQAQYNYLDDFAAEVESGLISADATASRAGQYASAAYQALWQGLGALVVGLGYVEESWHMRPVKTEHCEDCPALQAMGWKPIGTFPEPGDGSTQCHSNCNCYKLFRDAAGAIYGGD